MEIYAVKNLTFTYPNCEKAVLSNINLSILQGEFVTICGKSGCGKTTFLRLLKPALSPFGDVCGSIFFAEKPMQEIDSKQQTAQIGFVMQDPDNQIVTDKVWHELAFGLESLGCSTTEIRTRVAEMASFFGMQTWFHKNVAELSGGQKQLLNLAAVMVMQPSVLILDEPTSQLDPIAAQEFLHTLEKINRELGTTIILTEHRLEDAFPISDRIVVMDEGEIIADGPPEKVGAYLKALNHEMYDAMPTPVRIHSAVENNPVCPVTVRAGRVWLEQFSKKHPLDTTSIPPAKTVSAISSPAITVHDAWFRYDKNLDDVIKGFNLTVAKGELFAIVGGNGTGKTTALSLISGLYTPYRGEIRINGEKISNIKNLYNGTLGVLPQNPKALFVKKTVFLDLWEMLAEQKTEKSHKEAQLKTVASICRITELLNQHPYDLSGGEQQRVALAKVLLKNPAILLLDEPTKGMDAHFKAIFADILKDLTANGTTIILVSHDIEFCAEFADRCAMFFDGNITALGTPREFFADKSFYTTAANRMARTMLPGAILAEDVILACGGQVQKRTRTKLPLIDARPIEDTTEKHDETKPTSKKMIWGGIFTLLFVCTAILQIQYAGTRLGVPIIQLALIGEMAGCFICFIEQKELGSKIRQQPKNKRKLTRRTIVAMLLILLCIPLTIYVGIHHWGNRKYYLISLLIILETLIPFFMIFEKRKPAARELITLSTLCAIAVAGRTAFFTLPQFKPVIAIVILAGVCFGGEAGFLVGAITGFVSNFFFGQGPLTPWQMFALGIIGFIAGILFRKGLLKKTRISLCIFGALAALIIYGGIMNPASVIVVQANPTAQMLISAYLAGIPFDLMHAASTAFFLWFLARPMIDKLERIQMKYGLLS